MKFLVFAALFVAVTADWQPERLYKYNVTSYTVTSLQKGATTGAVLRGKLLLRSERGGRVSAKLENPQHAQVHEDFEGQELPENLSFRPVQGLDQIFQIQFSKGEVQWLKVPSNMSVAHENLLKALVGGLQVDMIPQRCMKSDQDFYDSKSLQGQFRKMETDVTGACETLYTVLPLYSEWRRELPHMPQTESRVVEISKSRNHGKCAKQISYHFGVPDGSDWSGSVKHHDEEQLISRATVSRIIATEDGTVYKSETKSSVYVNPLMYGRQKAEVVSKVTLTIESISEEKDSQEKDSQWKLEEGARTVDSLIYSLSRDFIKTDDSDSPSSWSECKEKSGGGRPHVVPDDRSSSSSSSDQSLRNLHTNDDLPNLNEPSLAAMYMLPYTHGERKNHQVVAQKLVQEIAYQIQNPNNMPKLDTLSKFNVLKRIVASMNTDQLNQVSRSIEIGQGSSNNIKADMWMIYRDAVGAAGTTPAFQQIKTWIKSKRLQNEEAAQIVGVLANTLRYPTKEVMIKFFELAMDPEVKQQQSLNTTALLAVTKLINLGHVNNATAHSRYPTQMYGRLTWRKDQFVQRQVIPVLAKELQKAVQDGDSHKAQVYVKAIGNLGHRAIVDVFKPYLEGKVNASTYLRAWMVNSLDTLAWQHDRYVSSILYNFLKNTAEPYEVRIAALQTLFEGHISQAMMQGMAEISHNDPSVHVRAAIKSAITSAAKLENSRFMVLAKRAQEAEPMLTKEEFGLQHFGKYLFDHWDKERHLGNLRVVSAVDSEDSLLPKGFKFMSWNNFNGWTAPNKVSYSVSNVHTLLRNLWQTTGIRKRMTERQQNKLTYSIEKIVKMLNIKRDSSTPFEGNVHYDLMNQQRLIALSESDIQQLPQLMEQQIQKLAQGVNFHYTKIYNQDQVSIMFPVAMGVPFVYKYKQPTLIHILGKVQGTIQHRTEGLERVSANLDKEVQMTFARNLDGKAGFLDTLSGTFASAGVVNKFQISLPIRAQTQARSGKVTLKLEHPRPDQDTTLVHFSVWPYTSNQEKDSLATTAHNPTSKLVIGNERVVTIDKAFGKQSTGMQFQLQGYSHSNDYSNIGKALQGHDFISGVTGILHQKDIAVTHFNFKYLGTQSQARSFILNIAYGKEQKNKHSSAHDDKLEVDSSHGFGYKSENRRQEIVNKVSTGIKYANVKYIDVNATFNGTERSDEYVLTAAMADSLTSPNIQYVLYGMRNGSKSGQWEVSGLGKAIKPATFSLNASDSLKADLKVDFEIGIRAQENQMIVDDIKMQGVKLRTRELANDVKNSQIGQSCMQQIAQGNLYQSACLETLLRVHALDEVRASISYKNVSAAVKRGAYKAYSMLRYFGFWHVDENLFTITKEGQLEVGARANFTENRMTAHIVSHIGEVWLENVPTPRAMGKVISIYPILNVIERVANMYSARQYQPFCTIDDNRIETFANREIDYQLTKTWHVVMNAEEIVQGESRQVVILARRPAEQQQEVLISYKSSNGQQINIELRGTRGNSRQLATANVDCDYQRVSEGDVVIYRDQSRNQNVLEQHVLSDGVLLLNIDEGVIRVLHDGQRLVVLTDAFRNRSRGVCGSHGAEQRDDFLAPQGLIDDPQLFGASYALPEEGADERTMQLQRQSQSQAYTPVHRCTTVSRPDDRCRQMSSDSSSTSSSSSSEGRSEEDTKTVIWARHYGHASACELQKQVQFFHQNGELCITVDKVPSCTKSCRGHGYREQHVNVACEPANDRQFKRYKQQILQGQNPSIVTEDTKRVTFKVPSGCRSCAITKQL